MIKIVSAITFAILISTISGTSMNAYAGAPGPSIWGFEEIYAPSEWDFTTEGDGLLDESNAPDSVEIQSSDGGCFSPFAEVTSRDVATTSQHLSGQFNCGTFYEITVFCAGTIEFDWEYQTLDVDGSFFDPFGYLVNDAITQVTVDGLPEFSVQAGSESVPVEKGDRFGFWIEATDDQLGRGVAEFDFHGPACLVGGEFVPLDTSALLIAGLSANLGLIVPIAAGIVGVGAYFIRTRMN